MPNKVELNKEYPGIEKSNYYYKRAIGLIPSVTIYLGVLILHLDLKRAGVYKVVGMYAWESQPVETRQDQTNYI